MLQLYTLIAVSHDLVLELGGIKITTEYTFTRYRPVFFHTVIFRFVPALVKPRHVYKIEVMVNAHGHRIFAPHTVCSYSKCY